MFLVSMACRVHVLEVDGERERFPDCNLNLGDLYAESGQTWKGSFSACWLAGKPDYPQKLKVPEGYEKINENRNISFSAVS